MNRVLLSALLAIFGLVVTGCQNEPESSAVTSKVASSADGSSNAAKARQDRPFDPSLTSDSQSIADAESNSNSAGEEESAQAAVDELQAQQSGDSRTALDGQTQEARPETEVAKEPNQEPTFDFPYEYKTPLPEVSEDWIRLHNFYEIWIDTDNRKVIAGGRICLSEGRLEMFACPQGTKEHESIVSVWCKSHMIHAGLLAIDLEPGHPVEWEQTGILWDQPYSAATGPEIEIEVTWLEDGMPVTRRAQDMMLHASTQEPMQEPFVFAGSRTIVDENTGKNMYLADDGELVCVSNFSTAMIDLPVKSSASNESLEYIANPKMIPRVGTRVLISFRQTLAADPSQVEPTPSEPAGQGNDGKHPEGT